MRGSVSTPRTLRSGGASSKMEPMEGSGSTIVFIVEESFAGTLEAQGFEERLMRLTPPATSTIACARSSTSCSPTWWSRTTSSASRRCSPAAGPGRGSPPATRRRSRIPKCRRSSPGCRAGPARQRPADQGDRFRRPARHLPPQRRGADRRDRAAARRRRAALAPRRDVGAAAGRPRDRARGRPDRGHGAGRPFPTLTV